MTDSTRAAALQGLPVVGILAGFIVSSMGYMISSPHWFTTNETVQFYDENGLGDELQVRSRDFSMPARGGQLDMLPGTTDTVVR